MRLGRKRYQIIGLSRVRNEHLIIRDTIEHLESFCDGLIFYDDCSTDDTAELIERHSSKLIELIRGDEWRVERTEEETRHRAILYEAAKRYRTDWLFYADADERYEPNPRQVLLSREMKGCDAVRVKLFDAYMTPEMCEPYAGGRLTSLQRHFGPERRDILMAWRPGPFFYYDDVDLREPKAGEGATVCLSEIHCKHYGKALSVQHWEDTCDYYSGYYPEPYRTKWTERRGKAIHHGVSDFGAPLYSWDEVKGHAQVIHP